MSTWQMFRHIDDRAGGALQTFKRYAKFGLRMAMRRSLVEDIALGMAERQLQAVAGAEVLLPFKPLRAYLWHGLDAAGRARRVLAHFDVLLQRWDPQRIVGFHTGEPLRLHAVERDGRCVDFMLSPGGGLGREGEMMLALRLDGVPVMLMAFSLLPARLAGGQGEGARLVIGCFKGEKGSSEGLRAATQVLDRVLPSIALLAAARGLAHGWGLEGLQGVTAASHVFCSSASLRKRVQVDYDALWREAGAVSKVGPHHWALPARWPVKSMDEVPSSKRSQYRRRLALKDRLFEACAQAVHPA